jgi:ubiquinone/menaquinone biosynthesis C-methylase UbiE
MYGKQKTARGLPSNDGAAARRKVLIMRLFGWFRRTAQDEKAGSPIHRGPIWLSGRRVLTNTPYILPKDALESDRLNLQHHLVKLAAGGNYRAPIRQPRAILDVACGTTIWAREMAQQFPQARVVGFDIDQAPIERARATLGPQGLFPANFHFLTADALKPFPFQDGEFDFTHARFVSTFLPIANWPGMVAEMVRVTRQGGCIEIVDMEEVPMSPSPAYQTLAQAAMDFMAQRGLHVGVGQAPADYLRQAGAQRVQECHFVLGAGDQGTRQQRLLGADVTSGHKNLQAILVRSGYFSEQEYSRLLEQEQQEVAEMGMTMKVIFAFGTKL